jgi:hypothetical protein
MSTFHNIEYSFICPKCREPNVESQRIAGKSREEARQNLLAAGLKCSMCEEPLPGGVRVRFYKQAGAA